MLTPRQSEILSYLHSCPDHTAPHPVLVERFGADAVQRIAHLISLGLADRSHYHDTVRLTPRGLSAIEEYQLTLDNTRQQRAQEKADEALHQQLENERHRKDARRSWVQWTITTILSILSFFAGAVVEEFTGFMQWIASLFH